MTDVLLKLTHRKNGTADSRDLTIPNITTLRSLTGIIQNTFGLGTAGTPGYEVLGCRAPGNRARLRDLVISGIASFQFLQNDLNQNRVEITIVPLTQALRSPHLDGPGKAYASHFAKKAGPRRT